MQSGSDFIYKRIKSTVDRRFVNKHFFYLILWLYLYVTFNIKYILLIYLVTFFYWFFLLYSVYSLIYGLTLWLKGLAGGRDYVIGMKMFVRHFRGYIFTFDFHIIFYDILFIFLYRMISWKYLFYIVGTFVIWRFFRCFWLCYHVSLLVVFHAVF